MREVLLEEKDKESLLLWNSVLHVWIHGHYLLEAQAAVVTHMRISDWAHLWKAWIAIHKAAQEPEPHH